MNMRMFSRLSYRPNLTTGKPALLAALALDKRVAAWIRRLVIEPTSTNQPSAHRADVNVAMRF